MEEYLDSLPPDRREAISAVRSVILDHLPDGYEEEMRWGMISYEVPLAIQPDTYNGKPLMYAALASQKRHMAVYLSGIYADETARDEFGVRAGLPGYRQAHGHGQELRPVPPPGRPTAPSDRRRDLTLSRGTAS